MDPAISYRIVEDGPSWRWEVRRGGHALDSGTERSAVRARVQALLRGSRLARERAAASEAWKFTH